MRVLYVDDQLESWGGIMSSIFVEEFGCEMRMVSSAKEAISVLETDKIDLVFSDIEMPEMNGIELAENIANNFPRVKIILTSASEGKGKEACKAGFAFFSKSEFDNNYDVAVEKLWKLL